MTVIFEHKHGWLLCHSTFSKTLYENCFFPTGESQNFKLQDVFFEFNTPMLMDSAALKKFKSYGTASNAYKEKRNTLQKKRMKFKKRNLNVKVEQYHFKVMPIILPVVVALIKHGRSIRYFKADATPSPEEWLANNGTAREAAKRVFSGDIFSHLYESHPFSYEHKGDNSVVHQFGSDVYLLPPNSMFVQTDVMNILEMLNGTRYDVIVMDPPWQNKSAKRKHSYSRMKTSDLSIVPISELLKPSGLVIVWVTNNEAQITYVKEKLFPIWGLQPYVDWHWMKVTRRGLFITDLAENSQKKPYENLIIGRSICTCSENVICKEMEDHKVIVSIPSSIHSHKPPLADILKTYIAEDAKCLELFARYLLPGWTSCGNEVLKLQNIKFYEPVS